MTADADLVRRCRSAEPAALRELVERFQNDVHGLCYKLLRHSQDTEDVAQEVFIRVFRSLNRWDDTRPLRPWIMGIAVNRCRTAMGKRMRRPETVEYLAEIAATEEPKDDAPEVAAAIREAVDGLREDYREVFILFHESGQSYEEISESVDRPVGTVKTWLHRARGEILTRLRTVGLVSDEKSLKLNATT
ncbi:RNA polymerase sigma factor [soil metagenome]